MKYNYPKLDSVKPVTCHLALEKIQHELYVSLLLVEQRFNAFKIFRNVLTHTYAFFLTFSDVLQNDVWRISVKQAKVAVAVSQILFC